MANKTMDAAFFNVRNVKFAKRTEDKTYDTPMAVEFCKAISYARAEIPKTEQRANGSVVESRCQSRAKRST